AMCIYFLRSKTDNIKFIPISLALFILVAVLGPFSAFQVAERNQTSILKTLLEQNGRFADGKLQPKGPAFVPTDADRAFSCLQFLAQRNALSRLENWLPLPLDSIAPPAGKHNAYERAQALAVWLNAVPADQANALKKFISVYQEDQRPFSGDIAGFRSFYQIDWYGEAPKKDQTDARVEVSTDRTALLLFAPNVAAPLDSFSLQPLLRDWAQKAGIDESYALTGNQNRFDLQGTKTRARLFLQRAQFETTGDTLRLESLSGVVFVK
ncbi:MAG: hypothetical protein JNK89_06175, partial [Saprospiraceae bacterium]|nr:hypothetical protein [Saprospiraceae bacterium]